MAITFGMSTSEFWEEDPTLMWAYQKSFYDKSKIEQQKTNFNCWLQGMYIFEAVSTSLYNCFGRKNGQSAMEYVKEPYDFTSTAEERKLKEIQENEARIRARNREIAEILKNKNKGG